MTMIITPCLMESPKIGNLIEGLHLHELRDALIPSICIIMVTYYYPKYSTSVRDKNEETLGIEC